MPDTQGLMTYQQAAHYLGLKLATLYSLVSRNQIPHIRFTGKLVRFSQSDLTAWLAARTVLQATRGDEKCR